jgi:Ca-activated chloride channel family protein
MVLISDGQANDGIYDRGDLVDFAAQTAANGVSISTVGIGIDFDELAMERIAEAGHGNYYFAEDAAQLGAMFDQELAGLADVIAADIVVTVTPAPGVEILSTYGHGGAQVSVGRGTVVPIANLRAGEAQKVVLRTHVTSAARAAFAAAAVQMTWRRVADGAGREGRAHATVDAVADPALVQAAAIDRGAALAVEQAHAGRALDEAAAIYQRDGYQAAERVLQAHASEMHANAALDPDATETFDALYARTIDGFAHEPARTLKASREQAYHLSR